jgi:hypothetical protein
MLRSRYCVNDFDFAILYIESLHVFYVIPVTVFSNFSSTITLIETMKRQRKPKSNDYRERWSLLSEWARQSEMAEGKPVKLGEALDQRQGNTEPSPPNIFRRKGVETR